MFKSLPLSQGACWRITPIGICRIASMFPHIALPKKYPGIPKNQGERGTVLRIRLAKQKFVGCGVARFLKKKRPPGGATL